MGRAAVKTSCRDAAAERVGAACGLADVSVTKKESKAMQETPVGDENWEYRCPVDPGFRLGVVVVHTARASVSDDVVIELAGEAFA